MKKESFLISMIKLIITVSLIVGIGTMLGILVYSETMPKSEVVVNDGIENKKIEEDIDEEIIEDETTNWQTYRNEEYGFEVKYPSEWKINFASDSINIATVEKDKYLSGVGTPSKGNAWVNFITSIPENYSEFEKKEDNYGSLDSDEFVMILSRKIIADDTRAIGVITGYWKGDPLVKQYDQIFNQILSTFKLIETKKSDIRTGKGEFDDGIDVLDLQKEIDEGDQEWKKHVVCNEITCTIMRDDIKPWRLDSFRVLQNKGESYGFTTEDLSYENSKPVSGESGKEIYKVKHKLDYYLVIISQPVAGYDKIWIISEIKLRKDICQPSLVGIGFKTERTNRVFEELNGKLNPILSPEQFAKREYKSYCIDWYNFESLPMDVVEKLSQKEIIKNLELNYENYWDLYFNEDNGIEFKYPKEFTNSKGTFGTPKLHFLSLNNNSYLERQGKWGVIDANSIIIDNRKTFIVKSGIDSMWKKDEVMGMVVRGRQESFLLKVPIAEREIYLEYIYSYDPQSADSYEKIQEYENIFMGILSSFKFIEKETN